MASYLDQIPKQLAARRKAFAAAAKNAALLPSCWAIVRSIANNMYDYMRNSVIGGCTFPDRPIYLSVEDAAFLNFGATPGLLIQDAAWLEAENKNAPPPGDGAAPSPETMSSVRRRLALLADIYGDNHHATRVYNLEAWLQEMYRDRLDVDFAEDLQRQIDSLNAYMDSVPKSIASTGLNARMSKGVMDAFNLFKTVTGSSHQLDREKMSFVDRRSYVNTIQKIELIMQAADESLGSAVAGRSVVREMFALWKSANYEMMALTRQLRVLWAGTSLDDRIQELADLLAAIQKALNRCSEESLRPSPQLPVVRADAANDDPVTRQDVVDAFRAIRLYDMVVGDNSLLAVRETRKFGPLAVVLTPGAGEPRYCWEIRKLGAADEDEGKTKKQPKQTAEREMDVDRRVRYPLNCLVVPINCAKAGLPADIADAWLEFNQHAFPVQFKEYLEGAKGAVPDAFLPPPDQEAKDLPASYARRMLARLTAAFVRWAHDGTGPPEESFPGFGKFSEFVLSRLDDHTFLTPPRYRGLVQMYAEAGAQRRTEMWRRCLGPRFALDRQLVAVSVLMKDWEGLRDHLKLLPSNLTKGNSNLDNGFAKSRDAGDPFGEHKALGFFRKFLEEHADLKSALVSVESQASIEVETLRTQSESLGRVFQYDQAAESMMLRQLSQIQEKRLAANKHIDLYLTGLMYALDGNLEAAESALVSCLTPPDKRTSDETPRAPAGEETGEEWFTENLRPREGKFDKRPVPGEDAAGTVCHDLLYYNLGIVYMKMNRHTEALMCWAGVKETSPPETSFLYRRWAEEHARVARENLAPPPPA